MQETFDRLSAWGVDLPATMERFLDDRELYLDCLHTFFDDPGFGQLGDAIQKKDYEAAFTAAHTLKGVSGNLGLTPLFDAICAIVEPLRAHDYSDLDRQYEAVMVSFRSLQALFQ